MNCCQCQGIEEVFSEKYVKKELARYRVKGAPRTTRLLTDALKREGVDGLTLLDIGGGVGAIQHELLAAGVKQATDVDASRAYIFAARAEAERRGLGERITFRHGDFIDLASSIPSASVVTLDRVVCCYHDMEQLVELSAERATKIYGLVFPRDEWLHRLAGSIGNLICRIQKSPFRTFVHPTEALEAIIKKHGLKRRFYTRTLVWQVVVYTH